MWVWMKPACQQRAKTSMIISISRPEVSTHYPPLPNFTTSCVSYLALKHAFLFDAVGQDADAVSRPRLRKLRHGLCSH